MDGHDDQSDGAVCVKLATVAVSTPVGPIRRVAAVDEEAGDGSMIDLTTARAAQLAAAGEPTPEALATATVPPDMIALLERGFDDVRAALSFVEGTDVTTGPDGASVRLEADEYELLAPLPRPTSLRDYMAIEEHVQNTMGADIPDVWYDVPVCYKGNPDTVVAPGATIEWPSYSSVMDYELELAAVIGSGGQDLSLEEAEAAIAGYTIFNDFSARDTQGEEMAAQLGPAKGKDFANGLGPVLVPADEIDVLEAAMTARVDGEVWSEGTVGEMHHSFPEIVAHASQAEPLQPGDVLGSGTVGEGCGLELGRFLEDGSTIELTVAGIGALEHTVVSAS